MYSRIATHGMYLICVYIFFLSLFGALTEDYPDLPVDNPDDRRKNRLVVG